MGDEQQDRAPYGDAIALGEAMAGDLEAVDERAVRAVEVVQRPGAVSAGEDALTTRKGRIRERDAVRGIPPERHLRFSECEDLAGHDAAHSDKTRLDCGQG